MTPSKHAKQPAVRTDQVMAQLMHAIASGLFVAAEHEAATNEAMALGAVRLAKGSIEAEMVVRFRGAAAIKCDIEFRDAANSEVLARLNVVDTLTPRSLAPQRPPEPETAAMIKEG